MSTMLEYLEARAIKELAQGWDDAKERASKLLDELPDRAERIDNSVVRAAARRAVATLRSERKTILRLGDHGLAAALIRIGIDDASSAELDRRASEVATLDDALAVSEASSEHVARLRDAELAFRRDVAGLAVKVTSAAARAVLPIVLGGLA